MIIDEKYFNPKKQRTKAANVGDLAVQILSDVNTINPALQNIDKKAIISKMNNQFPMSLAPQGVGLYMK